MQDVGTEEESKNDREAKIGKLRKSGANENKSVSEEQK